MANKSSYLLAVLFIANPFVLLFYQNCAKSPEAHVEKKPASVAKQTNTAQKDQFIINNRENE